MRHLLLLAALLAATPARAAETSLPALLRLLPPPGALQPGHLVLAYARVDLLAGQRGPTAGPGHTRAAAVANAVPAALGGIALGDTAMWPRGSGFDFDAVEALVLFETGPLPAGLRLLVGARMPAPAAMARPLAARGFAPRQIAGQQVLARGADDAPNFARRGPGDALGGTLALSLRYAMPAPGVLLATRADAVMAAALGVAASGNSLAGIAELQALAETSAGGPGARDLAQAMIFIGDFNSAMPSFRLSPGDVPRRLAPAMHATDIRNGPAPWAFAMLSERRDAEGITTRLAIPYRERAMAEHAATAMAVRLAATPAPPGLGEVRQMVMEGAAAGIFVAAIEARQPAGTQDTLMRAITARHYAGGFTPMTVGVVPGAHRTR